MGNNTRNNLSLLKKHLPENINSPKEVSPPENIDLPKEVTLPKNIDLPKEVTHPKNIGANLLGKQFAPTTHTLLL